MIQRVFLLLIFSLSLGYSLETIADFTGDTNSVNSTEEAIQKNAPSQSQEVRLLRQQIKQAITNSYSVHTQDITLGRVQNREANFKYFSGAIALIGCDKPSYRWLKLRASRLSQINPNYFIINCKDKSVYDEFTKATGIKAVPIDGDQFHRVYGINHYPVLITKKAIQQ
jgi:integrating conjugative element protein (TIGR03765 family)